MAVITPTAIVIISTLMLMVLKRIRLWISAIIFTLCADKRIRQIKDYDEFLLFLRERVNSTHRFPSKNQWGQGISRITSQAIADSNLRTHLDPSSSKLKNKRLCEGGLLKCACIHSSTETLNSSTNFQTSSDSSQKPMVCNQSSVEFVERAQ